MQKKIIVLAIAAAMTAPALALAEASVYGQANLSVDMVNDGAASNSVSTNQLVSNTSRIGVKGSEDLGGGMSVVWQAEGTVGMDNGVVGKPGHFITSTTGPTTAPVTTVTGVSAGQFFDRDTFIGLSNAGMGTLILGQHDTPYKMSTRKLDLFADGAADNRKYVMGNGHDTTLSNVIAYVSPDMSGFTVAIVPGIFGAETAKNGDKKGSAMSLTGMYSQGPIYATLAYQTLKFGTAGSGDLGGTVDDKSTAFKVGGSYSMEQFAVNLVIEQTTDTTAATSIDTKGTNIYLGGKFNVSSTDAAKLAYGKHGETKSGSVSNKDGATQISIGLDHNMSKTTTVYGLYTKVSGQDTNADPSTLSVGIKHSF
jgi:predicted porin